AIGVAGLFIRLPIAVPPAIFIVLVIAALGSAAVSAAGHAGVPPARASTLAVGFVPLAALLYAALFLMPLANEFASTRPLVPAILRQRMAPEEIYLYSCPYLWTHDMPRELERVQYERRGNPPVIITARKHASEIDLKGYRRVDGLRMIGKDFDVYRK